VLPLMVREVRKTPRQHLGAVRLSMQAYSVSILSERTYCVLVAVSINLSLSIQKFVFFQITIRKLKQ
jgi:hypothetical protein